MGIIPRFREQKPFETTSQTSCEKCGLDQLSSKSVDIVLIRFNGEGLAFLSTCKIKSVFGTGEAISTGQILVNVLFCRDLVPLGAAERFPELL